jgi:hypothetical protein
MEAKHLNLGPSISLVMMAFVLFLMMPGLVVSAQPAKKSSGNQEQDIQFGGTYANLKPEQRRLVDEWFRQFNEVAKENLKASEDYDELSLSVRTTFEAVTHALMTSKLTDKNGRSLGTALDVVQYIETVHGKVPEARGDLQFRIYVALKPTALQTLEESREFKRGRDNTRYHKGYPLNYRQQGGVPGIQISSSTDGKRADIDVDYRSAKFPAAIVNGHLSSANSDVMAGDNHNRHVDRWSGFANWWNNIFGVPLKESNLTDEEIKGGRGYIPVFPRAGKGKPEEAVYDFLNSWLVEQQPNLAVAYISPRTYSCIDQVPSDEKKKINPGLIPYYIMIEMKSANRVIGKPARLADAAESVHPNDPALKIINQPHNAEFALFEVPEDIAFDFECTNRNGIGDMPETKKPGRKRGKYLGASLRLKTPKAKGALLIILWAKEGNYWKIVSWDVDPDKFAGEESPDTAPAKAEIKLERVTAAPDLINNVQGFFDAWFVKQNFKEAAGYLSEQCYPCINLYLDEEEKKVRNWQEGQRTLIEGMKKISEVVGKKSDVADAIRGSTPTHPALKLITHPQEKAYTLVSVSDEMAKALECTSQVSGVRIAEKVGGAPVYGNYYGAIFELKIQGDPASLRLLWGRESAQWKIIAYSIEVP